MNSPDWHFAPPDPAPRQPHWGMPALAIDTHAHVFGPQSRYPYAPLRQYTPPDQTLAQYLHMLDATGLARGVLSQPSIYGSDNACLLDALDASDGRLRGIVVMELDDFSDSQLRRLHDRGVRGLRLNLALPGGLSIDRIEKMSQRLAGMGWHLEVLFDRVERLCEFGPLLRKLQANVVVEQMGTMRAGQPISEPGFQALIGLLAANENIWAKLSHPYKISSGQPPYADVTHYARALVQAAPDRLIWGSDWPHPRVPGAMPNDGLLLDLLLEWTGHELATAQKILSVNAAALYA